MGTTLDHTFKSSGKPRSRTGGLTPRPSERSASLIQFETNPEQRSVARTVPMHIHPEVLALLITLALGLLVCVLAGVGNAAGLLYRRVRDRKRAKWPAVT